MLVGLEDAAYLNIAHLGQAAVGIVERMGFDNSSRCFVDDCGGFAPGKGRLAPSRLSVVHVGTRHIELAGLKSSPDTSGI